MDFFDYFVVLGYGMCRTSMLLYCTRLTRDADLVLSILLINLIVLDLLSLIEYLGCCKFSYLKLYKR